jgi:hypothetical protein
MPVLIPLVIPAILGTLTWAMAAEYVVLLIAAKIMMPSESDAATQLSDGATQEFTGTTEPRRIVYGQTLVSGMNVIPPWTHGTNNQMLDQVLVLAGHEVDAVTDVWANQEKILSANITAISHSLNDGKVTTGTYADKLWIRRYPGDTAGALDYILNSAWGGYWDPDHLGKGIAYLAIQYQYDTTVYSGGKPEIRVMVRGKKVYDPRLDVAPGASPTNPAYIAYSDNPALCIIDYLMDSVLGVGEAAARIDWVAAVAAANCCDETVTVPGGTQKRYTVGCVLDCTSDYEDNLKALAGSMGGGVLYSAGKWVLLPGQNSSPVFAVGDDDVVGPMNFRTKFPFADRYNAVRGQFYDPDNLYQPVEYPPVRVTADENADGEGPVWRELQQPTCTNQFEAQRKAITLQRKSRRAKSWTFQAGYGLYGVRPGEFGTFSNTELGIFDQLVRCAGWKLNPQTMHVELGLEEVAAEDWNDPGVGLYQTTTALAGPAPSSFISDSVGNFGGTGGGGGITFTWAMPPIWYQNLQVELVESDTNNIAAGAVIWTGSNNSVFIKKEDTTTRYYWARVRNLAGNTLSPTNPLSATAGLARAATSAGTGPTGAAGEAGISASLSLSVVLLTADAAGHVATYPPLVGHFRVFSGVTDVTDHCTFLLAPNGNPDGIAYTLNADGSYAITGGMRDDVDQTSLTMRAVYAPTV